MECDVQMNFLLGVLNLEVTTTTQLCVTSFSYFLYLTLTTLKYHSLLPNC